MYSENDYSGLNSKHYLNCEGSIITPTANPTTMNCVCQKFSGFQALSISEQAAPIFAIILS